MIWLGIGIGVVVTSFVFIMWGHKNTKKIGRVRDSINNKIDETFD